jgi:DNA-binding IclR family transcriptional regulator
MPPRAGHFGLNESLGLVTIDERMWSIFIAYSQKHQTLSEISREYGLPVTRVRRIVRQLEAEVGRIGPAGTGALDVESAIEDLGLPVRTRNALRGVGCTTIGDIMRLDLSAPARGLGAKSKRTLLERLSAEGFCHPATKEPTVSEFRLLERNLERIQRRVDWAFDAVTKEISEVKRRLRRR